MAVFSRLIQPPVLPKSNLPAVVITPDQGFVCILCSHIRSPVLGFNARIAPQPGSSGKSISGTLPM